MKNLDEEQLLVEDLLNENNKIEVTKELINSQLDEFISIVFDENKFKFRPNQKETIVNIIYNSLVKHTANQIIEAPTGSGKSIINLLCATFLAHYYKKTSYILCSDLYLFSQYEDAIKNNEYFDEHIAYIKGQNNNYKCNLNGEDVKNGECRNANMSWKRILEPLLKKNKDVPASEYPFGCARTCEYCKQRVKLRTAKIVVTTYQNLLHNYLMFNVEDFKGKQRAENLVDLLKMKPYALRPKAYCFCDEAHNIPTIVQEHFTPKIKLSDFEVHEEMYEFIKTQIDPRITLDNFDGTCRWINVEDVFKSSKELYEQFIKNYENISRKSLKRHESLSILNSSMRNYYGVMRGIELSIRENIADKLALDPDYKLTHEDYSALRACNKFSEFYLKLYDVVNALNVVGSQYLLKKIIDKEDNVNEDEDVIEIHCMREDYLCSHHFINFHKHNVYTSATTGDKTQFDRNLGIPKEGFFKSEKIVIPSNFNFEKSPIKFLNKYSMGYKFRDENVIYLAHYINEITQKLHTNNRGMIQTGSYALMKQFMEIVGAETKKRLIMYSNSKEKAEAIEKYKNSKNGILIGPSLTQGIDLPHDLCRFIIIAKVPYMNIKDEFVKDKSKLFPRWYNSQASIEIIQGIGRGVRAQGDFCETYILDSCFGDLYMRTKSQYPDDIKNRLQRYTSIYTLLKEAA